MISALDTNILLDILIPNPQWFAPSLASIQAAAQRGSLVVCDIVYAELCGHFRTQRECDAFLGESGIRIERISQKAAFAASEVWRQYRIAGGRRERILPDFLIGAHAAHEASQLISRDAGFYRQYFSGLAVEDPAGQPAT